MDYITKENIIIFSPYFNEIIDDTLLSNYKKVIFSDYELIDDLFDNYENNNFKNCKWKSSKFN